MLGQRILGKGRCYQHLVGHNSLFLTNRHTDNQTHTHKRVSLLLRTYTITIITTPIERSFFVGRERHLSAVKVNSTRGKRSQLRPTVCGCDSRARCWSSRRLLRVPCEAAPPGCGRRTGRSDPGNTNKTNTYVHTSPKPGDLGGEAVRW